ncbi:MAG: 50S ribosomal protein L39e [Candidatus Lokiarchaeota archaeon]|nr:50S ribosomal protein L39e [Candidatus Lokiarchaeota archaeon]
MARNKNLPSKLRRAKSMKQNKSLPNWIIRKTNGKVRSNPYSNRTWRNTRLKRD